MTADRIFGLLAGSHIETLRDTPGIFYALAYAGAAFMLAVTHRAAEKARRAFTFYSAVLAAFLLVFLTVTKGSRNALFVFSMLITYLSVSVYLMAVCEIELQAALYMGVRSFLIGELTASLFWQIYYYLVTRLGYPHNVWTASAGVILFYALMLTLLSLAERRLAPLEEKMLPGRLRAVIALAIGLATYVFSNLSYVLRDTPFSSTYTHEIFIIRTLADLGGVIFLYVWHLQSLMQDVRLEKEMLEQMLRLQYDNYRVSEESIALVNRKYHDLKHQIELIKSETATEEKVRYLDRMEQEVRQFEAQVTTGNRYLDTILTAKSLQCQNEHITFTAAADGSTLGFMDPMDLAALFGNALDNAIEGARSVPDPAARTLYVNVSRQKNFLRIRVENRYGGQEVALVGGLPVTTKPDKRYHGFGSKSIKQVVEKYNGSMNIETKGGWYRLRILIPL